MPSFLRFFSLLQVRQEQLVTHMIHSKDSFLPLGLVAVFYAVKSLNCQRDGYYEQALIHSRRSLSWSMATYVIALFLYLTLGLLLFIRTVDHH